VHRPGAGQERKAARRNLSHGPSEGTPAGGGRILDTVVISKRVAWFLVAFGVWSWIIWPTFLKNIWADKRSWNHGMTAFFGVHLVLTVVSLALGTIIGVLGIRALRAQPRVDASVERGERSVAEPRS
jgi:hypothetical protein